MYLLCAALWYLFFAPIKYAMRAAYVTAKVLFLTVCCASGAFIVGSFLYGVYLGIQ